LGVLSRTDLLRVGYSGGTGEREILTRHQRQRVADLEVTLEHAEPLPPREGDMPVAAAMTQVAFRVGLETTCSDAARMMRDGRIHHLLVMHDERLVGVLSPLDLMDLVER
jgi:CBS domain-containing protein